MKTVNHAIMNICMVYFFTINTHIMNICMILFLNYQYIHIYIYISECMIAWTLYCTWCSWLRRVVSFILLDLSTLHGVQSTQWAPIILVEESKLIPVECFFSGRCFSGNHRFLPLFLPWKSVGFLVSGPVNQIQLVIRFFTLLIRKFQTLEGHRQYAIIGLSQYASYPIWAQI